MLDQIDQFREIEGFRKNGRYPHLQNGLRIATKVSGEDNDRDLAQVPRLLQSLQEIPAIHARHGQIEQDYVGVMDRQRALLKEIRFTPEELPGVLRL